MGTVLKQRSATFNPQVLKLIDRNKTKRKRTMTANDDVEIDVVDDRPSAPIRVITVRPAITQQLQVSVKVVKKRVARPAAIARAVAAVIAAAQTTDAETTTSEDEQLSTSKAETDLAKSHRLWAFSRRSNDQLSELGYQSEQ